MSESGGKRKSGKRATQEKYWEVRMVCEVLAAYLVMTVVEAPESVELETSGTCTIGSQGVKWSPGEIGVGIW